MEKLSLAVFALLIALTGARKFHLLIFGITMVKSDCITNMFVDFSRWLSFFCQRDTCTLPYDQV